MENKLKIKSLSINYKNGSFKRIIYKIFLVGFFIFITSGLNTAVSANTMDDLLMQGIKSSDFSLVETAVNNGANVNLVAEWAPLEKALMRLDTGNGLKIVNYLFSHGADPNARSVRYNYITMELRYTEAVPIICDLMQYSNISKDAYTLLLKAGADVNAPIISDDHRGAQEYRMLDIYYDGDTPLITAAKHMNIYLLKLLIKNGADVNKANGIGMTPLMVLCYRNTVETNLPLRLEMAQELLKAGADPAKTDVYGYTALAHAIKSNYTLLINLLLPISPKN